MLRSTSSHRRIFAWLAASALALFAGGCSQPTKSAFDLEASELLELLQQQGGAGEKDLIEADLGRFRMTHMLGGNAGQLHVQFHLIGIVPAQRQQRLAERLPLFERRLRDAVISLVQRTETEQLTDPSLALFKEEVVATVNRVLQERLVVDVAFSDFSADREPGIPWSMPVTEKPAKSGHGGGHGSGH